MSVTTKGTVVAINVGNRTTRIGLYVDGEFAGRCKLTTQGHLTTDEVRMQLRQVLDGFGFGGLPDGVILSCVVPSLTNNWELGLADISASRPLVVGAGLKTGVRLRQEDPASVGSDRVANVVAARHDYGQPVIVVSLGTTTNVEVVDKTGAFVGGIIAPGLSLGAKALAQEAARLPEVELRVPTKAIGRSTSAAMQSGVMLGEAVRIDGLLDAVMAEMGCEPQVVMTGGAAATIGALMRHDATVDEDLTLRGLSQIWYLNRR
jgi:type III pantothenate kinase